ncbi:hypothetical protein [Thalassomonas sp. M1454]|uniref:hypothetical protein n=1 Tax=Thalassomonas sp. M1454 TaxID=2594477 RepID=UPI00117C0AA0|nr:hypothetical protein [Thalassomonas sp. M1454]TRX56831.1 hypothetical protein FNN08_04745 [Thalassomonas sp. M1454]
MEDVFEGIGKGIGRAIGYILVDVLFNTVCYYIGWPICKLLTFGKYPQPVNYDYLHTLNRQGLWCSFVGFVVVILPVMFVLDVSL